MRRHDLTVASDTPDTKALRDTKTSAVALYTKGATFEKPCTICEEIVSWSFECAIRPLRVVATNREATKHPCQGIAFGDSLRSGDMSDREAELGVRGLIENSKLHVLYLEIGRAHV